MKAIRFAGLLLLALAACAPAATPTAPPATTARPTATVAPTSVVAATATPQRPLPGGGATPQPTPTLAPTAVAAAGPKYGGTIRYVEVNDPRGWDGHRTKGGNADTRSQHNLNFSLLVTPYDATKGCEAVLVPELAQSWTWVTDSLLELKLIQGVRFHNKPPVNGREMIADDVAYSLDRGLFQEPVRGIDNIAAMVDRVEASDRYTVRIHTRGPLGALIEAGLASKYGMVVLAREAVEPYGNWNDPTKSYIGTGPFTFKEHRPGVKVVYEKHPAYFKQGLPYADYAEQDIIPDLSTQVAALRSGKVDMIQRKIPAVIAQQLEKDRNIEVQGCMDQSAPGEIYLRTDLPPFNDVRIRRALSMATDRQTLLDVVLMGRGAAGPLFPPTSSPFSVTFDELPPETRRYVEYHPDEARKLVAEAGSPSGLDIVLRANTRYKTPAPELAQAVAAMWEKVGIRAKIVFQGAQEWESTTQMGDFPGAAFMLNSLGDRYRRYANYHGLSPETINRGRIKDLELDKLIDQVNSELDPARAIAVAKKLEARVIDQAYEISLPAAQDHAATNKWVKGYKFGDPWYTAMWLERIWLDR
ncbi:MAG: ABC transporter substrate-binding protein [Chloroflexi bacterium]|nr:ABC transporter substrate-binding protein [Chloroflexota bacterium]